MEEKNQAKFNTCEIYFMECMGSIILHKEFVQ